PRQGVAQQATGYVIELAHTRRHDHDPHRRRAGGDSRGTLDEESLAGARRRLGDRNRVGAEQRPLDRIVENTVGLVEQGAESGGHGRLAALAIANADWPVDGRRATVGAASPEKIHERWARPSPSA